ARQPAAPLTQPLPHSTTTVPAHASPRFREEVQDHSARFASDGATGNCAHLKPTRHLAGSRALPSTSFANPIFVAEIFCSGSLEAAAAEPLPARRQTGVDWDIQAIGARRSLAAESDRCGSRNTISAISARRCFSPVFSGCSFSSSRLTTPPAGRFGT